MKKAEVNEVLYHIGFSTEMIEHAEYAILLDDIKYVERLAKSIDKNAKFVAENREYLSYLVEINGEKVVIVSTGFGAPPLGIGIEEMAMVGLKKYIRLGEAGAIQYNLNVGDIIVSKGSIRKEGTSRHYAPMNYPAAASFELTQAIRAAAEEIKMEHRVGITATVDTLWPVANANNLFDRINAEKYDETLTKWRKEKILCVDNAISALFTMCNVFGLESAAILDIVLRNFDDRDVINGISYSEEERIAKWSKLVPLALTKYMQMWG